MISMKRGHNNLTDKSLSYFEPEDGSGWRNENRRNLIHVRCAIRYSERCTIEMQPYWNTIWRFQQIKWNNSEIFFSREMQTAPNDEENEQQSNDQFHSASQTVKNSEWSNPKINWTFQFYCVLKNCALIQTILNIHKISIIE